MSRVKEIELKVIPSKIANNFIKNHHYSGKVVNNSFLHFGAFLDKKLHGVMSFATNPSLDKKQFRRLDGYMLRYIYFIDKKCINDLNCEIIPFSKIKEIGAGMYKGAKV